MRNFLRFSAIAFHYMNNTFPCNSTLNEGSPFKFSKFKDQFVIVVRQIIADEKFSAILQTIDVI